MQGKAQLRKLSEFARLLRDFLDAQPPAKELDASSAWLNEFNAMNARLAEMEGMAEGFISQLTYEAIKAMPDEEYKKIKNSSTLVTHYTQGKFPGATRIVKTILAYKKVMISAADNTRTLMSSYRQEMEFERRTQVRQTP